MSLLDRIRIVKDFPIEGIEFLDLTTLWKDPDGFKECIDVIMENIKGLEIDKVVAIEARGFILASALAYNLSIGFIPIRKKGKLPSDTLTETYSLEYGNASIEIHKDAISKGDKILLLDDVLATGGTAQACQKLINKLGGEIVSTLFFVEIEALEGRKKLSGDVVSILKK